MKTPLQFIREDLFGVTQSEFGAIANASQSVVSRWESGNSEPSRDQMANIREDAIKRGIMWDDSLFFTTPESAAQ
jgi:transcriptional regulator with XRE-family HTH domain